MGISGGCYRLLERGDGDLVTFGQIPHPIHKFSGISLERDTQVRGELCGRDAAACLERYASSEARRKSGRPTPTCYICYLRLRRDLDAMFPSLHIWGRQSWPFSGVLLILTTGQDFLHSCRHFLGLHLSELTMAILVNLSAILTVVEVVHTFDGGARIECVLEGWYMEGTWPGQKGFYRDSINCRTVRCGRLQSHASRSEGEEGK